jgi:ATP-dependent DNA helicase RecQ
MNSKEVLKKYWGYDSFKDLQEEAINAALECKDSLVILPTGGGKSLCFQIPALCLKKMTLVISPLISLMNDQVLSTKISGINSAALHSGNIENNDQIYVDAINGKLDLLYVSPERLASSNLIEKLQPHIGLIAIDEAHCISHWGHDFRPSYRKLAKILCCCDNIPKMALTATATPNVQEDICSELKLKNTIKLIGHMDRPNLTYRAIPRNDVYKQIKSIINKFPDSSGIIYAQTRKKVDQIAIKLRNEGIFAVGYHAGLSQIERKFIQDGFLDDKVSIIVATIAFGMGIDKSNVRFVIHVNMPKNIEQYQQESGRAGRDGLPAECVLFYKYFDIILHKKLSESNGVSSIERQKILTMHFREIGQYCTSPICRHKLLLKHFSQTPKEKFIHSCNACDICLGETKQIESEETKQIAKNIIKCVVECDNRFGTTHIVDILVGSKNSKIMKFEHNMLNSYGSLKSYSKFAIKQWIDQLIVQDFLKIKLTYLGLPLLSISELTFNLNKNLQNLSLTEIVGKVANVPLIKKEKHDLFEGDLELFENLRELRKLISIKIKSPPYIVFSDVTLHELSKFKPTNFVEFLDIKGVAKYKCEKYGPVFIKLISENCSPEEAIKYYN